MKLLYLRLENFIGIYNGLGLETLEIDFSLCKHKIIAIKGDNGSGKSTLNKALTPLPDNSIEIIPNKLGKKVLRYLLNDFSILYIEYQYQFITKNNRKLSKCIIRREINGQIIDLNPSMNMTNGRDIIYEFLNLDDNYITLSQLSANNKGLGSLKPSERKKYVNNIITSLQEYNDMYKLFTKKSIGLKSLINSISTKIKQIGNLDIIKNILLTNQNQLEILEKDKEILMGKKAIIINKIDEIKKNGDIITLFKDLESKRKKLENDIENMNFENYSDDILIMTEKELTKLEVEESNYSNKLKIIDKKLNDLVDQINTKEEKLRIFNDENSVLELFKSYQFKKDELEKELNRYITSFNEIGFENCKNISEEEYTNCLDLIDSFNTFIDDLLDSYDSREIVEEAYKVSIKKRELKDSFYKNAIISHEEKLKSLESKINMLDTCKKILEEDMKKIPKDCNHLIDYGCPFLDSYFSSKKILDENNYDNIMIELDKEQDILKELNNLFEQEMKIKECSNKIISMITYIKLYRSVLKKFPNTKPLLYDSELKWNITNFLKVNIDISIYREYTNYISLINHAKEDIKSIDENLIVVKNDLNQRLQLMNELKELKETHETIVYDKSNIEEELIKINNEKNNTKTYLEQLYFIKSNKDKLESMTNSLEETNEKLNTLLKQKDEYLQLSKQLNDINMKLETMGRKEIPIIKATLDKAKYSMSLYEQYKKDYESYESIYSQIQIFRQYSSINGIQTIYMEAYMNSILKTANELLRNLFNGVFLLQPFIINESEFKIPCIDNEGRIRQDISLMSDSQLSMISMIISFSLLYKVSGNYNIIKLDEVDSNLDNNNRLQFSVLINKIMDILDFSQCIIISHNNELDLSNSDMIIFKMEDQENYSSLLSTGGNVVFDINKF